MAVATLNAPRPVDSGAKPAARFRYLNLRGTLAGLLGLSAVYGAARVYQQAFGWSAGLDSTQPAFETYWMNLLYAQLVVLFVVAVALWSWLWATRDRHLDQLEPKVELKRYFNLVSWILLYVFGVYATASFFGEQDAAWHQTVVRDTSFTPSHIILFYLTIPIYIILGVGSFLYAMTRLPEFARRLSVPFIIGVTGPFLILPNLGFNEWGHAFWMMEELFIAPLHWGFVVLGWSALALGGLLIQAVTRMIVLFREIYGDDSRALLESV